MQSNWTESFKQLLAHEGGFSDDTRDPGNKLPDGRAGSTMLGVTQANWEAHIGHEVRHDDMRALTGADVEPLYKRKYWDAVHADDLPSGIDFAVFDMGVNAGPGRSIKLLQSALGVNPDGGIGPMTMAAIQAADALELLEKFSQEKEAFYRSLPTFGTYGNGWLNRIASVRSQASSLIA